jgi:hypothetical protein
MTVDKFLKIGIDIAMAEQSDPFAQMWLVFVYSREMGSFLVGGMFVYSKPEVDPPVFKGLQEMSKSVISSQKIKNFTEVYTDVDAYNIPGYRQVLHIVPRQRPVTLTNGTADGNGRQSHLNPTLSCCQRSSISSWKRRRRFGTSRM